MLLARKIRLGLQTRAQADIQNEMIVDQPHAGLDFQVADLKKNYPDAIHRPVRPGQTYNCHGLTFAARRTRIWNPAEIIKILKHDGYLQIARSDVLPGDIAVYYSNGDIEHSGIVISAEEPPMLPKILSKIGDCHEMVHFAQSCDYDATNIKYYRIIS